MSPAVWVPISVVVYLVFAFGLARHVGQMIRGREDYRP